jgi:hypothetical protein
MNAYRSHIWISRCTKRMETVLYSWADEFLDHNAELVYKCFRQLRFWVRAKAETACIMKPDNVNISQFRWKTSKNKKIFHDGQLPFRRVIVEQQGRDTYSSDHTFWRHSVGLAVWKVPGSRPDTVTGSPVSLLFFSPPWVTGEYFEICRYPFHPNLYFAPYNYALLRFGSQYSDRTWSGWQVSIPVRGNRCFTSPPLPDRLCGPPSFLPSVYKCFYLIVLCYTI